MTLGHRGDNYVNYVIMSQLCLVIVKNKMYIWKNNIQSLVAHESHCCTVGVDLIHWLRWIIALTFKVEY